MPEALYAITLIWGVVFIYAVMASIDFGAGFWSMIYLNKQQTRATNIANRYLSPSWEVTNVFIVAIVVALFSFFPGATFTLGTVLLIPGSIILLLLALRSAFLVFSHVAEEYKKGLTFVSGITGFLIPALLISVLPITQGGFIDSFDGNQELLLGKLFTSPSEYAFVGFAISSTLFLSSLLLADYSNVAGEMDAYAIYRKDAIIIGPISLLMAAFIIFTMRNEANWLYENILNYTPWMIASIAGFALGYAALWFPHRQKKAGFKGMPRIAMISVVAQYLFAGYAYGSAHLPYIVYPDVTIESGFTHPETFRALIVTYIVAFFILTPGFIYFWRLFLKDKRYVKPKES
ncbi:cytochrome d ubiquinol oxidase subunit II [Pseudalkalibacillus caeni]|uniref:Cytochrome d ubiquinol oxidase subunit II n=1 Tax=Exobacillus caeni TaxID=2574798 RepID=A0A5R9F7Z5_9BACL|nr:cytochrome d ubiquinol oxidase subunit II [Pseudalkalibacillus caeni]TLS39161.1 cytochrome d ubiquinol oxidase subunit II [Pseudalkalibacillus caeni]